VAATKKHAEIAQRKLDALAELRTLTGRVPSKVLGGGLP
jgi:hypothetical protein